MEFKVTNSSIINHPAGSYGAYLIEDRWDDWGKFRTQFQLAVFDESGQRIDIGDVKIGQAGLEPGGSIAPGVRAPTISHFFNTLEEHYFSLGQDETYYETLQTLPEEISEQILMALRDCAYDLEIFNFYRNELVMNESLLRFVSYSSVIGKLNRLAHGNLSLTPFHFDFIFRDPKPNVPGPTLEFHVIPEQQPPTNVHVLIGRNGAGKTRFLQALARSILDPDGEPNPIGTLTMRDSDSVEQWAFAGLVYVSFSAFDDFELPRPSLSKFKAAQVSLIGEGSVTNRSGQTTKGGARLFSKSFDSCRSGLRRRRWIDAIAVLESDPLFEEAQVKALADLSDIDWREKSEAFFGLLSSGHAIVLLTITRLVELVDERTIVLIDEPEGHLHPPLLAALIRSLSDLLTKRNGLAIIATHSPVVLQEVPRSCAWVIRRSGPIAVAERPQFETFGENVGSLTREVFGLEVTASGFHKLINDAVLNSNGDYQTVLNRFDNQLGTEARAIARGLTAEQHTESGE